jgi:hypothetical protein
MLLGRKHLRTPLSFRAERSGVEKSATRTKNNLPAFTHLRIHPFTHLLNPFSFPFSLLTPYSLLLFPFPFQFFYAILFPQLDKETGAAISLPI